MARFDSSRFEQSQSSQESQYQQQQAAAAAQQSPKSTIPQSRIVTPEEIVAEIEAAEEQGVLAEGSTEEAKDYYSEGGGYEQTQARVAAERAQQGIKVEQPKTAEVPQAAPEPAEAPGGLTSQERGFTVQKDWKVTEKNSRGRPTVYTDSNGIRHYTPDSTMWKLGFREGGTPENPITGKAKQGQYRGGTRGEIAYVAVNTAGGIKHITQAEAQKLAQLDEKNQFYELQSMGIVPEKDSQGNKIKWQGTQAQQSARAADVIKATETLKDFIKGSSINIFAAAEAAGKNSDVRRALYDLGYSTKEVRSNIKTARALADFKTEDGGYKLAEAVNAGVPAIMVANAFGQQAYNQAKQEAKQLKQYEIFQRSTPQQKFNQLVAMGDIPKGATFEKIDDDGNIVYTPPEHYQELQSQYDRALSNFKALPISDQKAMIAVARSYADTETQINAISQSDNKTASKYRAQLDNITSAMESGKKVSGRSAEIALAELEADISGTYNLLPYRSFDNLTESEKATALAYHSNIEPMKIMGITVDSPAKIENIRGGLASGKAIAAFIPGVGTAVYWNDDVSLPGVEFSEKGQKLANYAARATNVIMDALIVLSWAKPGIITRVLGGVSRPNFAAKSAELLAAEKVLQQDAKAAENILKTIDPTLVKPYKDMVQAQKALAANLAEAKEIELAIAKYGPGGEVNRSATLATLKAQTPSLEARLKGTAETFVKTQNEIARGAYNEIPLAQTSFASDIVKDTRSTVNLVFQDIKGVKTTERQIASLVKQLDDTKATATRAARLIDDMQLQKLTAKGIRAETLANSINTQKKVLETAQQAGSKISMEIAQKQAELLIAKSGQAQKLHTQLIELRASIEKAQQDLNAIQKLPGASRQQITLRKEQLAKLINQESKLTAKMDEAIKAAEVEWAEPLTRGGGNILVNTRPPRFIPGQTRGIGTRIGGGSSTAKQANVPLFMAMAGQKVKIWSRTDDGELVVYEPRNPYIQDPDTEIFIFEPGKTPYPGGLVTTAPPKPGVKPVPITPPIPKPEPYTRTWIIEAPKIGRYGLLTDTQLQQSAEAQEASKGATGTETATGIRGKTGTRSSTKASALPSVESSTEAAPATKAATKTLPATATQTATQTKTEPATQTAPVTQAAIKTATEITTKTIKPPTKKVPPPLSGKGKDISEWTEKEIKSAIAYKTGFIVHAAKAPYSGPADITSFHVSRLPKGMRLMAIEKGKGSVKRSARVTEGRPPSSLSIDQGVQDVLIKPSGRSGISLSFRPDPKLQTIGNLTVKKSGRIGPSMAGRGHSNAVSNVTRMGPGRRKSRRSRYRGRIIRG